MAVAVRDKEFYTPLVICKVEDTLFRIPEDDLKGCSEVFRDMFSIPRAEEGEETLEGSSDSNPIVLEGVKANDFRALLRHLQAKKLSKVKKLDSNEWVGVHALAHMWGFEEARKESKDILFNMHDAITKFELGTRFDYDDWIRKAYEELSARPDPLSIDEAKRLGLEAAMQISRLRELRSKSMATARTIPYSSNVAFGTGQSVDRDTRRCPHCSSNVKYMAPLFAFSFGQTRPNDGSGPSGGTYSCTTCNITLRGDSPSANDSISKEISNEILKLIPMRADKILFPASGSPSVRKFAIRLPAPAPQGFAFA
ncbi:hypothetical protein SCHPADRAFT_858543 [Schizopora paradoxa]|uniref:BTB domain-containing protein n=1 Tax=Schizopora paradoxa TaxID=27342 RepID=A0A0H2RHE5_9AGAM|nr:hypothetical protein SCHPADRAFT_858543 [Schizopora paradoxa]